MHYQCAVGCCRHLKATRQFKAAPWCLTGQPGWEAWQASQNEAQFPHGETPSPLATALIPQGNNFKKSTILLLHNLSDHEWKSVWIDFLVARLAAGTLRSKPAKQWPPSLLGCTVCPSLNVLCRQAGCWNYSHCIILVHWGRAGKLALVLHRK